MDYSGNAWWKYRCQIQAYQLPSHPQCPTDGDRYRKPQRIKLQSSVPTNISIMKVLHVRRRDYWERDSRKVLRTGNGGVCCRIACPRNVRSHTLVMSHQHGCLNMNLRRMSSNVEEGKLTRPHPQRKSYRQWKLFLLKIGEIILFREEPIKCLYNTKWSALKAYLQVILHELGSLYLCF